jgi:glycosyltransferase involved in cell wall biosynthesis
METGESLNLDEPLKPMITTIIPTYRRPQQLKQAILSVLHQTYPHFRVCVYDNASGDDTALIVAELAKVDPRVKYYCHEENIGAIKNFQFGLEHVETPFFSFLSDDDFLLPDFYQIALGRFEKYPDAMFSATDVIISNKMQVIMRYTLDNYEAGYYSPPTGLLELFQKGNLTWTGILFRHDVKEIVGLLDCNVGAPHDHDFINRIAAKCPFVLTRRPGAVFINWGQDSYYFQSKAGLRRMIANLKKSNVPADILRPIEHAMIRRYQRRTFSRCLYYLKREDGRNALMLAQELKKDPGSNAVYAALEALLRWPFYCSLFGHCVRAIRDTQDFLLELIGAKRQAVSPRCPDTYLESDVQNIKAQLEEQRQDSGRPKYCNSNPSI